MKTSEHLLDVWNMEAGCIYVSGVPASRAAEILGVTVSELGRLLTLHNRADSYCDTTHVCAVVSGSSKPVHIPLT